MNWLVGGYYGLGNIGDEMMCRCIVDWIQEMDPAGSVAVLMARGGEANRLWLPDNVGVHSLPSGRLLAFRRLMRGVDAYIVGGGTCFHRYGVAGFYQNLAARSLGVKVLWIGIGADELGSLKNRVKGRISLACADEVTVRDLESVAHIEHARRGMKPEMFPDLVFNYTDTDRWATASAVDVGAGDLVVAWRNLAPYLTRSEQDQFDLVVAPMLNEFVNRLGLRRIIVLNTADAVDEEACRRLYHAHQDIAGEIEMMLIQNVSLPEKLTWLKGAGAVLSARLHPLMLAAFAGKPIFGLAYAEKMLRFASLLNGNVVKPLEQWTNKSAEVVAAGSSSLSQPTSFSQPLSELSKNALQHRNVIERVM